MSHFIFYSDVVVSMAYGKKEYSDGEETHSLIKVTGALSPCLFKNSF